MKKIFIFVSLLAMMCLFSFTLYSQEYSIKGRWNVKASYSLYRMGDKWDVSFDEGAEFDFTGHKMNLRLEGNYGLLDWLEVGVYGGFQKYDAPHFIYGENMEPIALTIENAYAPTFGVNANIHILPLFVKNEKSRWELYFTAKYGGCFFSKWGDDGYGTPLPENNPEAEVNTNRYRHEYGIGVGGGVYFWNLVGIYAEASFGQYSFFPDSFSDPFVLRGGISFKIDSKKK